MPTPNTPQPLVLLPGLLCDADLWRDQIAALGDGVAPFVADLTRDDDIGAMAERTLAAAPPRFALVGLSMGGYVAFEIMRRAPERVTRLALIDTSASPDARHRAERRAAAMDSLAVGKFAGVTTRLLPQLVHPKHVDGPVGARVRAMAARVGGEAFLRQQRAILARPDFRPGLSRIRVPTWVAVGDSDVLTPPAEAREIFLEIANATLHVFEACGHLPPLEQPAETSRFLARWLLG